MDLWKIIGNLIGSIFNEIPKIVMVILSLRLYRNGQFFWKFINLKCFIAALWEEERKRRFIDIWGQHVVKSEREFRNSLLDLA